ncbi:MAG: AAA family ATPase, partial [Streptosporangiaceae bacterium]|nr:AAA family ATPase [Streptosporangiaceae bacterium]
MLAGRDRLASAHCATRAPRPSRGQGATCAPGDRAHPLLEREGELHQLELALDDAALGHGRLIVLYGTAGIGRSSLLETALQLASSRNFDSFRARGSEWERAYAFGVARQLLEAHIAELQDDQVRSLFDGAAAAALPALGLAAGQHGADRSGFDQIYGLHLVVSRLAANRQLIIAVDDVHWCDRPSLDFLCFLGQRARQLPLVVALSWRRGEPGAHAGRLQALAGERDTLFLTPQPLSAEAVRGLMARELGTDPDEDAVKLVLARTGGAPFLVTELVAALRRKRIAPPAAAAETIATLTPERVRRDVAARLGRQPEPVRRLAHAFAVLGDGCSLGQAAQLAKVSPEKAPQLADALIRAGFLRLDRTLSFVHPVVRDATYETLSPVERAGLHSAAAALMTEAGGDVDIRRVAGHLLRTGPSGDPRFGRLLREAGLSAICDGALPLARRCLQRALEEPDDGAKGETLALLGALDLRVGELQAAEQHLRQALPLARSEADRLSTATACAEAVAAARGCAPAIELLHGELGRCSRRNSGSGLSLQATIASLRLCHHVEQPGLAAEPLDCFGDGTAAERTMVTVQASLAALHGTAAAHRVIEVCSRAVSDDQSHEQASWAAVPYYLACRAALLAEGIELVEEALPVQAKEPFADTVADHDLAALALRCQLRLCRGDLRDAGADAAATVSLIETLPPTALRRRMCEDAMAVRVVVELHRGSARVARQRLSELTTCGEGRRRHPAVLPLAIMLGLLEGRAEEAISDSLEAGVCQAPTGIAAPGVSWRPALALAYQSTGKYRDAMILAAKHLEAARAWGAPAHLARALLTQAAISSVPSRRGLIEQALELLDGTRAELERAQARIELGAALRRERRRREAREELIKGADLAHHCGAIALVERAHSELVAAGARPRRRAFSGLESLTPSERRVAELAASEMTTRQIANVLTVSMKTVAGQLSAVYRKLDVHDRRALATV